MINTIVHAFGKTVCRLPEKKVLSWRNGSLTFSELYQAARKTAHVYKDLGISKGDRIGICMGKTGDQAIAIIGAMLAGAVFVPVLPKLKQSNIEHIINDCQMSMLVTDAVRLNEVTKFADKVNIVIGSGELMDEFPCFPYLRKHMSLETDFFDCIGQDTAAIIYSSGSTGRPKGIVISHRNLFDGAQIVSTYLGTQENDRICAVLSFNFDYGLNQLWQALLNGCTLYLHDFSFPADLFKFISENKLTVVPLMPVLISRMFDSRFYKEGMEGDTSQVRYVCTSGGPVSDKMIENIGKAFGNADFFLMYGLTEAFRSTYLPPSQLALRPRSIGKAIPDVEMYIIDEEGQICASGEHGELVHRGGCISKGYWNNPEMTAKRFRESPLFPGETLVFSGDIAYKDEEGYIYFVARGDSMIKTYGFRVSPSEVEEEVAKHESISAAVVFGIQNIEIGQDIVMGYETVDGKPLPEMDLMLFMKRNLPSYMNPKFFIHFERFKSTGNEGKVDRTWVQEECLCKLGKES